METHMNPLSTPKISLRKPKPTSTKTHSVKPLLPADKQRPAVRLKHRAEQLYAADKFSHSGICAGASRSLERFWKFKKQKAALTFADITEKLLKEYEQWMLIHGKSNKSAGKNDAGTPASITTISMYVAQIRSEFRLAMKEGVVGFDKYPFGNGGVTVPTETHTREPRTQTEIQQIAAYQCEDAKQEFLRDMWMLSYLMNGINAKDICLLRWPNIDLENKTFVFVREKSRSTSRNIKKIQGVLFPQTLSIIIKWASSEFGDAYLFPILSKEMPAIEQENQKKYFILLINRTMKKIGEDLGLPGTIKTYCARHSFVNHLLQKEVPVPFISEALGHADITTTQHYISKFPSQQRNEYLLRLVE
jgi:integrase/recombinase XerD